MTVSHPHRMPNAIAAQQRPIDLIVLMSPFLSLHHLFSLFTLELDFQQTVFGNAATASRIVRTLRRQLSSEKRNVLRGNNFLSPLPRHLPAR